MTSTVSRKNVIRSLNDEFRRTFTGGRVRITSGIASLPGRELNQILTKVRLFDDFNEENDPYGEHDFGSFEHTGRKLYFKIDYYDENAESGSGDPANPDVTTRIMTLMLACEY